MYVMLRTTWQGNWRRCVRDPNGNVIRTLIFGPGVPVEPSREDLEALKSDIGGPLVPIEFDRKTGAIRPLSAEETEAAMDKAFGRKRPERSGDDGQGKSQGQDQDPPNGETPPEANKGDTPPEKGEKPETKGKPQTARS